MMKPSPQRPDARPLILLLIVVVFLSAIASTAQQPADASPNQTQPVLTTVTGTALPTPTPTRFPEHLTDQNQTNGIILGSTVLVLIVIIGTLTVIRHGERRS
jgi:hypothetical protein